MHALRQGNQYRFATHGAAKVNKARQRLGGKRVGGEVEFVKHFCWEEMMSYG
jgi:hypothetical protein